ncbi:MAG: tRNA pseudouridine(38-40) synthase TruA [Candidatus Omnitrophota bacterium]
MLKNIFLKIEYLGTNYFGFQLQNKKDIKENSVQEALEGALFKLYKKKIRITYASRTDRGVHAGGQAINFKIDSQIPLRNIKSGLNAFLPQDIRVKSVKIVPADFHARFWAKSKIYRYIILNREDASVFWENFAWHRPRVLDLVAMRRVARELMGKKDFSLFAKEERSYNDCTRCIKAITLRKKGSLVHVDIEANGFLRNMARNIVSFLVAIGEGRITVDEALSVLERKRHYHNKPAPACGLYLMKVKY